MSKAGATMLMPHDFVDNPIAAAHAQNQIDMGRQDAIAKQIDAMLKGRELTQRTTEGALNRASEEQRTFATNQAHFDAARYTADSTTGIGALRGQASRSSPSRRKATRRSSTRW